MNGNGSDVHFAFSNNSVINGKMVFDCSSVTDGTPCVSNAGVSKFQFQPGKDHLLRLVNVGSSGLQFFTIDEHDLTVIANDYIPVKPYTTNSVTLGVSTPENRATRRFPLLTLNYRSVKELMLLSVEKVELMRSETTGCALTFPSSAPSQSSPTVSQQSIMTKRTTKTVKRQPVRHSL